MNEWIIFLSKPQKRLCEAFFGTFWAVLACRNFLSKIMLRQFLSFMTLKLHTKKAKKTDELFLKFCFVNGQTNRAKFVVEFFCAGVTTATITKYILLSLRYSRLIFQME